MIPIVTCSVSNKCVPVLAASVEHYCPDVRLIVNTGERTTFGEAFNLALAEAFTSYDEVIICNDDIVLTPSSYTLLMEDVESLKTKHGHKLGLIAAHTDSAFPVQNIRFDNGSPMDRYKCQWEWEKGVREAAVVAPIFAWISKTAFETAQFPPLNWYSDDVICRDLSAQGFKHFISRAYVHHVGSQTVGKDYTKLPAEAEPWLRTNRPAFANEWFGNQTISTKKPLKICVYAISKNEEQFVERWVKSATDADLLLVADTGSTDNTVEVCANNGVATHKICITPWRFDRARDAALALIPADIDICVSLDLDEVLEPGWREEIERLWMPSTTRMRYFYDWGGGLTFKYEKIHARHGYHWHHPCHEYPRPDSRITEIWAETDKLLVSHHPDPTKSRGQYLDLLALSVKEDPLCPRNAFYYARELYFNSRWDEAIVELKRYLAMPSATWNAERAYAMRTMLRCFEAQNNAYEAEAWGLRATAESPHEREPWFELTAFYYRKGRWNECYFAALRTLALTHRVLNYTNNLEAWGELPHDYAAIAAFHTGRKDEALKHGEAALAIAPNDFRLLANLKWYKGETQ